MLTKYNRTIVASSSGAVVPEAVVEFRYQFTGALAPVYSDVNGTNAILNPTTADENGFVGVFLNPGIYRIIARQVPGGVALQDLTYELVVNSTVADPQAISSLGLNPHGIENISILFEPEAEGLYVNVASRLGAPFSNENYSTVAFRNPEVNQDSSYAIVQINNPLEVLLDNSVDFGIGASGQQWMFVYLVWDGSEVHIGIARKTTHDEGVDHTTLDFSSNDVDRILTDGAISTPCTIRLVGRFVATRSSGNWSSVLTPSSYQSETTFITQEARKLLGDSGDFQFSGNVDIDGFIRSGGSLVLTEDQVGVPYGVASLNSIGQIPAGQLPSYVDDVLEFADFSSLPTTGESGKIYITVDNNEQYRWTGSTYVQLIASPGTTDNVPEGAANLYFTQSRVRSTPLAGFVAGVGLTSVLATDTILQAFQKLQGWLNGLGTAALANVTTSASDTTSGRLWRTNDLVKTTSTTDTTFGRMMKVGDGGLLGTSPGGNFDLATALGTVNRFFWAGSGDSTGLENVPEVGGVKQSGHGIQVVRNSSARTVVYFNNAQSAGKRMWIGGGTDTTMGPYYELWSEFNLAKTASATDTTDGRIMQVGDGGLLGRAIQTSNLNNIQYNGFIGASAASNTNKPSSVAWWVGLNLSNTATGTEAGQIVIGTSSDTGLYYRARYNVNADSYFPWHRVWDDSNLTKSITYTDTTVGSIPVIRAEGIFGLGNVGGAQNLPSTGAGSADLQTIPTGLYIALASSFAAPPFGATDVYLDVHRGGGSQAQQTAYAFGTVPRKATRNYMSGSWSAWREEWNSGNLVKTTSATDTTPGSMLKVGDGGLLSSMGSPFPGFTTPKPIGWYVSYDISDFPEAPAGATGAYSIRVDAANMVTLYQNTTTGANREIYQGVSSGESSAPSNWIRYWHTGNTSEEIQDFLGSQSVWQSLADFSSGNTGYINICIDAAIQANPEIVKSIRQTLLTNNTSMFDSFNGGQLVKTNNSSYSVTLEADASLPVPIGFNVTVINDGSAGNITIARGTGVVLRMAGTSTDANRVIAPYGQATLIKIATNTWRIVGVGVS